MAAAAIPLPGGAGRPGLGKMAAAAASGRGGLGRAWVFSGWALGLCSLLASGTRPAAATTHWVVTEDGKIQQQVSGAGSCPPPLCPGGGESPCPELCGGERGPSSREAPARGVCRGELASLAKRGFGSRRGGGEEGSVGLRQPEDRFVTGTAFPVSGGSRFPCSLAESLQLRRPCC